MIAEFPDDTTNWELCGDVMIKVDAESGYLLCPECGKAMTAVFNVTAQHLATVDETCTGDEVIYDHDTAGQNYDAVLGEIICNGCHFSVTANGFTLDRVAYNAQHPAEEWKA